VIRICFVHILLDQQGKPHSPPLGALTLVEILRQAGHDVSFLQFCHRRGTPLSWQDLAAALDGSHDVVAASLMLNALPLLALAARQVRAMRPHMRIVAGGAGFAGTATAVLEAIPALDAVATGESEQIIVPLMAALRDCGDLSTVPGLAVRLDGRVIQTPPPPLIDRLDEIPPPALDLIRLDDYHHVPLWASRGCTYACTFCDLAPSGGRRHRRRSPENVVAALSQLQLVHGVNRVGFVDDLFVLDRNWVRRFCELKRQAGLDARWRCTAHVRLLDDDLLATMADAGCDSVFIGAESGSDRTLGAINKPFTTAQAEQTLNMAASYVAVQTNLLWGFPFETADDVQQTLLFRRRLIEAGIGVEMVMLAPLALAPITLKAGNLAVFSPSAPNIFYRTYADLVETERAELLATLRAHPQAYGAFYHFPVPHLEQTVAQLECEMLTDCLCHPRDHDMGDRL